LSGIAPFRWSGVARHAAARASALVVAALLSACAEVVAVSEATTAPVESAVRATSAARALSGTYAIDSITLETRYWDATGPLPNAGTAPTVFNGLDATRPGYTNEPYLMPDLAPSVFLVTENWSWNDTLWTGIRNPAGASTNIATRYRVVVNALTQSEMLVQFAVDFKGGAMYVDGAPVAEGWNDLWWNGSFQYDTNSYVGCKSYQKPPCVPEYILLESTLSATVSMTPGRHVIEVIGFENANDGGAAARIDVGSGFQPLVSSVQPNQALTVTQPGSGTGRVVSSPGGLDCPSACTASFRLASQVTLTATAGANSIFAGWTGACSGNGPCTVSMYGSRQVGATFAALPSVQAMSIETRYWNGGSFTQTGTGAIAYFNTLPDDRAGYTNAPVPVTTFVRNASLFAPSEPGANLNIASRYVTVMHAPGATTVQFRFGGDMSGGGAMLLDGTEIGANWSGGAGGPFIFATVALGAGTHTITVVGFENCCDGGPPLLEYNVGSGWIASQAPPPPPTTLTIAVPTPGGRITSAPAGIDCGPTCQALFATGSQVVLTATPNPYFAFSGWGGECSGTGTCAVRMLQPSRSVVANFTRVAWPVSVVSSGSGGGTVTSTPAGTPCGTDCLAFAPGTSVTFSAVADGTSEFAGWSVPGCPGSTCTVTVNSALTVSALFNKKLVALTVAASGAGTGTITSSPAGINCGTACTATFGMRTTVTLTATPSAGSDFTGWTGAGCSGTGNCTVTMSQAQSVTATFTPAADRDPPVISCKATPSVLWPVNHKMVPIKVNVSLTDASPASFTLVSVLSNEPTNMRGDGSTSADISDWNVGSADVDGLLRAERNGTLRDRIYTLTYRGTDSRGNTALASCSVTVPHDQR
jgi:hypothetical protein